MFTFRAQMPGGDQYSTYTAESYTVDRGVGARKVTMVALRDGEATTDKPVRVLTVGKQPDGLFDVVYVMNAAGKTVDTIR